MMAANGISTLATKELRQTAKLDIAQAKRQGKTVAIDGTITGNVDETKLSYRTNNIYDLSRLPTVYSNNTIEDNNNIEGLLSIRPWKAATGFTVYTSNTTWNFLSDGVIPPAGSGIDNNGDNSFTEARQVDDGNGNGNSSILGKVTLNNKVMFSIKIVNSCGNPAKQLVGIGNIMIAAGGASINYPLGKDTVPQNELKGKSLGFDGQGNVWAQVPGLALYPEALATGYPTFGNTNDIIDIAVDLNNYKIWLRVNGNHWNGNINYDPSSNIGGLTIPSTVYEYAVKPACSPGKNSSTQGIMKILNSNSYPLPLGFTFV